MAQYSSKQVDKPSVVEESLSVYPSDNTLSAACFTSAEENSAPYTIEEIYQRLDEAELDYAEGRVVDAKVVLKEIDEWLKVV